MMTARPLAQAPHDGTCWPWLAAAAEMSAAASSQPCSPGSRGTSAQTGFPRVATRTMSWDLASVAAARGFARLTLQRWGLADRCDDITLVVSELLVNALRYARPRPGGWPVRLGLLQSGPGSEVLCAVADPSPAPPEPRPAADLSETGRGLHVVNELADSWGYTRPGRMGKVVWATFAAEGLKPASNHTAGREDRRQQRAPGRHRAAGAPDGADCQRLQV
jgi:anti-sigma regulatory factor (Ser/Thr protein kinase)